MRVSVFRGGYATLESDEIVDSWDSFVDLVASPVVGPKNGDYFIRGGCDGTRCDESMSNMDLIIIDGDQLLTDGGSCCPPQPVHDVLKGRDIRHVIYNSYSNDLINGKYKWRLCVPSEDIVDQEALTMGAGEIVSMLQESGLKVKNVKENLALSQPWFLPRCPEHTIDDFFCAWHDGGSYRIGGKAILDTARVGATNGNGNGATAAGGQFSWDFVLGEFKAGTVHIGLKAAIGWLVRTTDWADSQIRTHMMALVSALCPDAKKVRRAETDDIERLIKYCRKKSGVTVEMPSTDWKAKCITADQLQGKIFPPVQWAVDELIPEGLTIFAGDPKVGKSLVAVDVCSAIASGARAFATKKCVAGGAIYVSLEDPERRVKDRIQVQWDKWPDTFRLVTGGIPTVGKEFFEVFDEMVMVWPDTRCIIVDTLQYVVPEKPNGVSDYNHYYKFLGPIHDWALENHIAVVLITHNNKSQAQSGDNPFNKIIGSVAIQGCADAMLMLERNHSKGKKRDPSIADGFLHITGREIGNECYALEFDDEAMKWSLSHEATGAEVTGNLNWMEITSALKAHGPLGPKELSDATGINKSTVKSCLRRMFNKSFVEKGPNGSWQTVGYEASCNTNW